MNLCYCSPLLAGRLVRNGLRTSNYSETRLLALKSIAVPFSRGYTKRSVGLPATNSGDEEQPWQLPAGSWDTHVHVFDPAAYPYSATRAYSPCEAPFKQLLAFNKSLTTHRDLTNMVLVQPSPYGADNSLIVDILRQKKSQTEREGTSGFKAVVVLDVLHTTKDELLEMHKLGVRGIRLHMDSSGHGTSAPAVKKAMFATAAIIKQAGLESSWFVQLYIPGELWDELVEAIQTLGVLIIADHLGGLKGSSSLAQGIPVLSQPGLASLLSLAGSKHAIIKVSGFYRSSTSNDTTFDDLEPLIKRFAAEVPEQLVWGSDWPHTGKGKDRKAKGIDVPESFQQIDDVAILKQLRGWIGERMWERIMISNPKRIYGGL